VQVLQTRLPIPAVCAVSYGVEVSMLPVWQFAGILFLADYRLPVCWAGCWCAGWWQQLKHCNPGRSGHHMEQVNSPSNYSLRVTPDRERLFGALQTSLNLMLAHHGKLGNRKSHSALREQRAEENDLPFWKITTA
jgi:hypothetical protein